MYIILYLLSFNYFHIFSSTFYEIAARLPTAMPTGQVVLGPLAATRLPAAMPKETSFESFEKIDQDASNKKALIWYNIYRDSWVIQLFRRCFLNLGEMYWNILISGVDLLANVSDFSVSWRWTSREVQQLATEVWFPCSKHNFVEALCPTFDHFWSKSRS